MQNLIEQLTFAASSAPYDASSNGFSEAHGSLPTSSTMIVRETARDCHVSLEQFLTAGLSALLSRLLWHECISLVEVTTPPRRLTFTWEDDSPFRTVVQQMQIQSADSDASLESGVSVQFLTHGEEASSAISSPLRLLLHVCEDGSISARLFSTSGLWSAETLQTWLHSLLTLWQSAAQNPELPARRLPLLDDDAVKQLASQTNPTFVEFSSLQAGLSVSQIIARQATATPAAIAVRHGDQQLTYKELDLRSTLWAHRLQALGSGADRPVAICMERSELLPIAMLAILKSGSCYVPLDPHHPRQRLHSILEECQPVAVISDSQNAASLREAVPCPVLRIDETDDAALATTDLSSPAPDDLAYIIYTSGTTGKPKGVQISHRSLLNLLETMRRRPGITAGDRWLAVATISFDIATMDMLLPLVSGATLVIASRLAGGDPFELAALIEQEDITVTQATPFTLKLLANSDWPGKQGLKVIAGGEALPRDLANQLNALGCELWNCYGPTETTIYSSVLRIETASGIVPIGGPVDNTSFYVMDDTGRPVPPGIPGELYIGGLGVSRGYLMRPELTAERFVQDPLTPGARCFRTGDLVRALTPDICQFMGRLDHQVKLRGFRIELGEIESVLRSHPIVADAAVTMREDVPGEQRLIAYFTQATAVDPHTDTNGTNIDLRAWASRSLPEYMLPSRIVRLEQMPLTGSGKVDRKALPSPENLPGQDIEQENIQAEGVAPATPLEAQLLAIFREVLSNSSLGVTDSFFDYGGYSLLTARLFSRIYRTLGHKLPISMLFDGPTPRKLAALVETGAQPSIIVPIRTEGTAAPLFVVHSYLIYAVLLEAIEPHRPIYGIRELDDSHVNITLEQRATLYCEEIMKTAPTGPVHLAGWCAAGSLTVEVARLLCAKGRAVTTVALFDAQRPGWQPESAKKENLLKAKIYSYQRFHRERMRSLSPTGKLAYLYQQWARRWRETLETIAVDHRHAFSWVQLNLPILLPEQLRYGSTGVAPQDLQPSGRQLYPGEITLFRATDVAHIEGAEPSLGWDTVATKGVRVEFAPGDHESMFRPPQLDDFGLILRRVLRESEVTLKA